MKAKHAAPRRPWWRRKRNVVIGAVAAALLAGGTASAYFLLQGAGTTTATANIGSAPTQPLTITQAAPIPSGLTPGGSVPVYFSVSNLGTSKLTISAVQVTVTGTSVGSSCPASWFTITAPAGGIWDNGPGTMEALPYTFTPSSGTDTLNDWGGGSPSANADNWLLNMPTNSGTDQSACENATVNLSIAVP